MNNENAARLIDGCRHDLMKITHFREAVGSTNTMMELMTKYSVIKCCGTIEQCFKIIIYDYFEGTSAPQAKNFIEQTFKKSSMNPNLDNIHRSLNQFDGKWNDDFKRKISVLPDTKKVKGSLASLNQNRNQFAHGDNTTVSFDQVVGYFEDSCKIIAALDDVVTGKRGNPVI